jgi:hypothetical protein
MRWRARFAACGDKVVCTHGRCFRRTRRVGDLALPLGCGLGLSVPGTRLTRSVPSPAAALCNFAPSSAETCWGEGLAVGPGRGVYVCPVDPHHGQDPCCGG